jgi:protein-tyrosine phosphatase
MVDIHCHILPGMDDGAETMEQSVEMAEMAIADGITHVVATPHANAEYRFNPELIRERRDELQQRVGERLTLLTGCDFHLNFENLQDLQSNHAKYTINQKNYLLVEFADFSIPPGTDDTLHHLLLQGISPIITHPERNRLIRGKPHMLRKWLRQGCYVQMTAQSLLGGFGESTQRQAEEWLEQDMVHFFASDAHNTDRRPLQLRKAFDFTATKRGEAVARALFLDNPLAAVEGRPLPFEPEPPEESARTAAIPRRKRFIFF